MVVEEPPEQGNSQLYTWTIRALYAVGLAANVYLLYTMMKDQPEVQIAVARWKGRWARAKAKLENCEGCAKRRAALNRMLFQAQTIVEEAREAADG